MWRLGVVDKLLLSRLRLLFEGIILVCEAGQKWLELSAFVGSLDTMPTKDFISSVCRSMSGFRTNSADPRKRLVKLLPSLGLK
jgi:hypothetical protein